MTEEDELRIVTAALELAAVGGWRAVSFSRIAATSGVPLSRIAALYPDPGALGAGIVRYFDHQMLAVPREELLQEPVRDRLFEVLMTRLESMQRHRPGLLALTRALPFDPWLALNVAHASARSAAWMLEAAGLPPSVTRSPLHCAGIAAVFGSVLLTWCRDHSADLGPTMKALDRALQRSEPLARMLGGEPPAADAASQQGS